MNTMDYCVQGQGHSKGSKCQWLSGWHLLNCRTVCFQILYCDATSWTKVSWRQICLLSRPRSQGGLTWSKYDSCYSILWTADSLATKLVWWYINTGQHVLWKKLDYCIQDQGHSKISKHQWMFVQTTSSELPNILLPNLEWWYHELEWHAQRFVCYLQGQGQSKSSYDKNMTVSNVSSELLMTVSSIFSKLLILLLLDLGWWYIIISQSVLWRNWIVVFKVQIIAKLQNVNECLPRQYLLNRCTFYHLTLYGDTSSWARMSFKKIGLLSSRSRSQWMIM